MHNRVLPVLQQAESMAVKRREDLLSSSEQRESLKLMDQTGD
jgi:hypothetical protein